jgi:tetratricopeptide (TPR) repeat protein
MRRTEYFQHPFTAVGPLLVAALAVPLCAHAQPAAPVITTGSPAVAGSTAFQQGMEAYKKGDSEAARTALTQAVAADPQNGDAQAVLGFLLAQQGKYDLAIPHLEKATTLKSVVISPSNSLMNYGKALLMRSGHSADDTTHALALFEKAAALSPKSSEVQMTLAFGYGRTAQYDKAAAAYRAVTSLAPKSAPAWKGLGLTLRQLGQKDDAYDALQKAAAIDSADADTWANLGDLALARGDSAAAQNALETARKLDGKNPAVVTQLGNLYARQQRFADAAEAYGAAADIYDAAPDQAAGVDRAALRFNQGVALGQAGHGDDAAAAYDKALAINPKYPEALLNSGYLLFKQSKLDDAIARFKSVTELQPGSVIAWKDLAAAETQKKDWPGTAAALRKVAALDPQNYDIRDLLIDADLRQNPVSDEPIKFYRQMAALRPHSAEPLIGLGLLYQRQVESVSLASAKQEKLLLAMQAFEQAIRREPRSAVAYNDLGVVHERRGEMDEAIKAYKKALALDPNLGDARQNLDRFPGYSRRPKATAAAKP